MLGFEFRWSEIPSIIKFGFVLWAIGFLCFIFMVAAAIFPSWGVTSSTVLKVAYLGGTLFTAGVLMMIFGLPRTKNRHPNVKKKKKKSKKAA